MLRITLCILLLAAMATAENHIDVVYPKEGQQIAAVDSEFVFGNTNPKAKLTINGFDIQVHKDGGFLAFLPVEKGEFTFEMQSDYKGEIAINRLHIMVGRIPSVEPDAVFDKSSLKPAGRTVLTDDAALTFSIDAIAGGEVYCSFAGDSILTTMYPQADEQVLNSVFGDVAQAEDMTQWLNYTGYLPIDKLADSSRVYFLYQQEVYDSSIDGYVAEYDIDSTDYYIVKLPSLPPRSLHLVGRPHIIRTGPGAGYKLVNQPAGVRFVYIGETPDFYAVKLTGQATGYIRKADARPEPLGTPPPSGEVSFITVDNYDDYISVSMAIGDKLPYEIHTDGDLMTIDIYYLNSDTDWIRFNDNSQQYIKSIWWSQPQDKVYRLNIRWYDDHFWGYEPGYADNAFYIKLKKHLDKTDPLSSPVKDLKIVLDPGHSHDNGAMGPTGLAEKNANLWLAYELRKILMAKGADVIMTRMGHEHLGIYDRVDIAGREEADLLISIHNNALPDGIDPFTHNGTSAYYYFNQARPLAEAIHKRMLSATGLPDHGLYHGNLALCRVTDCPAVLVECAFMMLPEQEAALKTDKFQRKCAKAIYQGICDYLRGE